jgi:hypothetical protein
MQPKAGSLVDELKTGYWPAVHRRQIPLWESVSNVDFSSTGVRKMKGYSAPVAPTAAAMAIRGAGQLTQNDGSAHIYYGDRANLYRWDGSGAATVVGNTYTGIQHETSTAPATVWSMAAYGDWMIATNGVDVPQVMKGAAASATVLGGVSGNFTKAQIVRVMNEHIVMLNTSNGPYEIRWSSAGAAETWTPSTTATAGFLSLREARSPIIAAEKLQQYLGVYTREGLFLLEYVGSPALRFRVVHALDGIGACGKQSVVPVGRMNYGCGPQGFWRTDGGTFEYIDDPAVRSYFLANLNFDQVSKVCGFHNEDETSVTWYYPTGSGNTENAVGLSYNYKLGVWTKRSFGRTMAIERNCLDDPFSGDANGQLYRDNDTQNFAGSAPTCFARTKGLDLGDETVTKYVTGIRINYVGSGLTMRIGYQDTDVDVTTYPFGYVAVTSGDIIPTRVAGKLIYLELFSNTSSIDWDIYAIDFFGRVGGQRETV